MPPSIVLEVLQALEAEMNLREETRVAEQAKPAKAREDYASEAIGLSRTQDTVRARIESAARRIHELPDSAANFGAELRLLDLVARVMKDAAAILARPETGAPALAAETEAIELLLQSKRINPKGGGGGGGGNTPGGGSSGSTVDAAIALLGNGSDDDAAPAARTVSQTTGDAEASFPEEFRSGLDEYFRRLEQPAEND